MNRIIIISIFFLSILTLGGCGISNNKMGDKETTKIINDFSTQYAELLRLGAKWGEKKFFERAENLNNEEQEFLNTIITEEWKANIFHFFVYDNQSFPTYKVKSIIKHKAESDLHRNPSQLSTYKMLASEIGEIIIKLNKPRQKNLWKSSVPSS